MNNPLDAPPIRAAALPGQIDPTGELAPDLLIDAEMAPPPPVGYTALRVEFRGDAGEYTRLWLLGLLLNLVTLGVYSPWAAVARRRYLASRTFVGELPLVYHGAPQPILRGRVLVALIVIGCWVLSQPIPAARPLLIACAILAAPWFLIATFDFDARNHSWRGIHFGHRGSYRQALKVVLPLMLWPASMALAPFLPAQSSGMALLDPRLLLPWVLYALLWPWTVAAVTHLRFDGLRYGSAACTLRATSGDFYDLYIHRMAPRVLKQWVVIALLIIGLVVWGGFSGELALTVQLLLYFVVGAIAVGYARGRRFNFALHRLDFGQCLKLRSTLVPEDLARIYFANALWVAATLGLAAPWRRVETLKLRCRHVTVYADAALLDVRAHGGPARSALGESLAEGLNLDLSL